MVNKLFQKKDILAILANRFNDKRRLDDKSMCKLLLDLSLAVNGSETVVDLGCGSGRVLVPMAKLLPKVKFVGMDMSQEMLQDLKAEIKQNKIENIEAVQGDMNALETISGLKNESVGSVILFQGIHFVTNLNKFLESIDKILAPKGRLIIATTTHNQFYNLPYCVAFPGALKRELKRTPDEYEIMDNLIRMNYRLRNRITIKDKRFFGSKKKLEQWLKLKPFSVLGYLSDSEFEVGCEIFANKYSGRILIDEFAILTFEKM